MTEEGIDNKEEMAINPKIEAINKELAVELDEWEKMGVEDPNQLIMFNPMHITGWIKSLTKFLVEKGVIDEDEFIIAFKQHMLDNLREVREKVEPQVREARLQASGIVLPNMTIPKGKIREH